MRIAALQPRAIDPAILLATELYALAITMVYLPVFPLMAAPLLLFLLLAFVAYRYLSAYIHVDWHGNSGGLLAIIALRISGWLTGLIPFLFGLVLLGRREWTLGAIALVVSVVIPLLFEMVYQIRQRKIGAKKDTSSTASFERELLAAGSEHDTQPTDATESQPLTYEDDPRTRRRSNASIFEMIAALAPTTSGETTVASSASRLPLPTEAVDDTVDTRKAAALGSHNLHPDQPHVLPPLSLSTSSSGMTASTSTSTLDPLTQTALHTLYPPSLIAPNPTLWLLDDPHGIGRMEVSDLQRWHRLDGIAG